MRLCSITANRHVFDGRVNRKLLKLLLVLGNGRLLRLQVAGDGEQMIIDDGPLHEPIDMGELGRIDVADVTQSLFPQLADVEVIEMQSLAKHGRQVGLKLALGGGGGFHFWVDGDELHWGDSTALGSHDWLNKAVPKPLDRIEF